MKALINNINHLWPIISLIALLIPTPLAKLRAVFGKEVKEHLPAGIADAMLKTDWNDVQSVITHLGAVGGTHETAVNLLVGLTAKSPNPLTPEIADWVVSKIETVYAGVILKQGIAKQKS